MKQPNLGYADVKLNFACMHPAGSACRVSLCVYYDLCGSDLDLLCFAVTLSLQYLAFLFTGLGPCVPVSWSNLLLPQWPFVWLRKLTDFRVESENHFFVESGKSQKMD